MSILELNITHFKDEQQTITIQGQRKLKQELDLKRVEIEKCENDLKIREIKLSDDVRKFDSDRKRMNQRESGLEKLQQDLKSQQRNFENEKLRTQSMFNEREREFDAKQRQHEQDRIQYNNDAESLMDKTKKERETSNALQLKIERKQRETDTRENQFRVMESNLDMKNREFTQRKIELDRQCESFKKVKEIYLIEKEESERRLRENAERIAKLKTELESQFSMVSEKSSKIDFERAEMLESSRNRNQQQEIHKNDLLNKEREMEKEKESLITQKHEIEMSRKRISNERKNLDEEIEALQFEKESFERQQKDEKQRIQINGQQFEISQQNKKYNLQSIEDDLLRREKAFSINKTEFEEEKQKYMKEKVS